VVGQCPNGEKEIEQVANQNMVKDGSQVEGKIYAKRLSDCTTQAGAESEIERNDGEGVH